MTHGYHGEAPVMGAQIVTSDGVVLGTVAEIAPDRFKVSAPLEPDYWLRTRRIAGAPGGIIQMDFRHEQLGGEKEIGPGGQDDPSRKGFIL